MYSNLEKGFMDETEFVLENMINDTYSYDEDYRNKLADYTKADLEYIADKLINDDELSYQINETIEYYINKHFSKGVEE